MFSSVIFWYSLSFIIFVFVVYRLGWQQIMDFLDQRIKVITNDIADAEKLKNEAQKLYLDARTKHKNSKQVELTILEAASGQVDVLKRDSAIKVEEIIKFKNLAFERQKKELEGQVLREVKALIIEQAIDKALASLKNEFTTAKVADYYKEQLPLAYEKIADFNE